MRGGTLPGSARAGARKTKGRKASEASRWEEAERIAKIPIHRRWPGAYAFRVAAYLPDGSFLKFETDMPEEGAKMLLQMLTVAVTRGGGR